MITIVVPTRNRSYTLKRVAPSYYEQELVNEIVFVSDCSTDDTPEVIAEIASSYPAVRTKVLRNDRQSGAAFSRNAGFRAATNPYILFCDDDEYLEPGYAKVCLEKLQAAGAGAVSGRRVVKLPEETPADAVRRFANGLRDEPAFNSYVCEFNPEARFAGDQAMPLTNSVILTPRALLDRFGFDTYYARGSGFREESDYQMNLYTNGFDIIVTNAVHSIHLHRTECQIGGARRNRFSRLYWAVYFTGYFYRKYYERYAERVGLGMSRQAAIVLFAGYQIYFLFVRPAFKLVGLR